MNHEIYSPTAEDQARLRPRDGFLKVSGDGIFATRQGEGVTAGENAIFLRLQFCNLACGRNGGWICDTGYTWDTRRADYWQEPVDMTFLQVADEASQSWSQSFPDDDDKRIVVTGGEPLLQQRKIASLLSYLPGWTVEIETNGTIAPIRELWGAQFNCSPKLTNSGNSLASRYRPQALKQIAQLPNSWFKFVVVNIGDLDGIQQMANECAIPGEKILVMPEGSTEESVSEHARCLEKDVLEKGWGITMRNQLIWYGPGRRT